MRDAEDERVLRQRQIPIAELARELDLDRHLRERLDDVFAAHRRVRRGAAPGEDDAIDPAQFAGRHAEAAELRRGFLAGKAAAHRVADRLGLLEDFLEHVVRVVALAHVLRAELDLRDLEAARAAEQRADFKIVAPDHGEVKVLQVNRLAGVCDDGTHIAREKILALPHTEHERRAASRADDHLRRIRVHEHDAVGADDMPQRLAQRLDESRLSVRAGQRVVVFADEMREHLGVGLPGESMALADQFITQRGVIFDHPVVADREAAAFVEVWMRVLIRHAAVRRPARVRDARVARERRLLQQRGEICDAARALARLDVATGERGDARGVVAAVFKPAEAVEEDWDCWILADVADDAAHEILGVRKNGYRMRGALMHTRADAANGFRHLVWDRHPACPHACSAHAYADIERLPSIRDRREAYPTWRARNRIALGRAA